MDFGNRSAIEIWVPTVPHAPTISVTRRFHGGIHWTAPAYDDVPPGRSVWTDEEFAAWATKVGAMLQEPPVVVKPPPEKVLPPVEDEAA